MNNKTCSTCRYFEAYYTKAYSCFLRTDCGHCKQNAECVQKKNICENWKCKFNSPRNKVAVVYDGLNDILTKINAIKVILEEEPTRQEK